MDDPELLLCSGLGTSEQAVGPSSIPINRLRLSNRRTASHLGAKTSNDWREVQARAMCESEISSSPQDLESRFLLSSSADAANDKIISSLEEQYWGMGEGGKVDTLINEKSN